LLLNSSSVILLGSGTGLDIIKTETAASRQRCASYQTAFQSIS